MLSLRFWQGGIWQLRGYPFAVPANLCTGLPLPNESAKRAGWRCGLSCRPKKQSPYHRRAGCSTFSSDAEKPYGAVSQLPELSVTSEDAIRAR